MPKYGKITSSIIRQAGIGEPPLARLAQQARLLRYAAHELAVTLISAYTDALREAVATYRTTLDLEQYLRIWSDHVRMMANTSAVDQQQQKTWADVPTLAWPTLEGEQPLEGEEAEYPIEEWTPPQSMRSLLDQAYIEQRERNLAAGIDALQETSL